jgi:hypothetical protein
MAFRINFPGQPKCDTRHRTSQLNYTCLMKVYGAENRAGALRVTVVDSAPIEQMGIRARQDVPAGKPELPLRNAPPGRLAPATRIMTSAAPSCLRRSTPLQRERKGELSMRWEGQDMVRGYISLQLTQRPIQSHGRSRWIGMHQHKLYHHRRHACPADCRSQVCFSSRWIWCGQGRQLDRKEKKEKRKKEKKKGREILHDGVLVPRITAWVGMPNPDAPLHRKVPARLRRCRNREPMMPPRQSIVTRAPPHDTRRPRSTGNGRRVRPVATIGFTANFPAPASRADHIQVAVGADLPARVYSAAQGPSRFSITVVDYNPIEKILTEKSKSCPAARKRARAMRTDEFNRRSYWKVEFLRGAMILRDVALHSSATRKSRVRLNDTSDLVEGLIMLHLTNRDTRRTYVGHLHARMNSFSCTSARPPCRPGDARSPGLFPAGTRLHRLLHGKKLPLLDLLPRTCFPVPSRSR